MSVEQLFPLSGPLNQTCATFSEISSRKKMPKRKYTRWTEELDEQVDILLAKGLSFDEAGAELGIGGKALQSRYRKRGLVHPSHERLWTMEEDEFLLDRRAEGKTFAWIAAKLPRKKSERACVSRAFRMKHACIALFPKAAPGVPSEPRSFSFE